jgi:putative ABC transport system permease protein
MAFFPVTQQARPPQYLNLLVRLANPAAVQTVVEVVGRLEPSAVLMTLSLESQIADQSVRERLLAILSTTFASAAAVLAMIGLYAIVSFGVTQRVQEIGIRVALGARSSDVVMGILRQGVLLTAAGVVVGLGGAAAIAPSVRSLLFGLAPVDPLVFAGVAIAFLLIALVAAYVPARRATRIDPIVALRCDN